jgi:hypothetical protein
MTQNQSRTEGPDQFLCDGCGKQFTNRQDLERHRRECSGVGSKQGSSGGMTHTAGGGRQSES